MSTTPITRVDLPKVTMFAGSHVMATTRRPSSTPVLDPKRSIGPIAFWGDDNLFPQQVIHDIERTNIMAPVINRKVDLLTSGGLGYGKVEFHAQTGTNRIRPMNLPDINRWLEDSNIDLYYREAAREYYTYYNIFPELVMGRAKDRVVELVCHDSSFVRLATMNDSGSSPLAYMADWAAGAGSTDADRVVPALEQYSVAADEALRLAKPRYILPTRELGGGKHYYALAPWNALRVSGWVDVASRVPELKMHLFKNLMHLRYHFDIAPEYWPSKFLNWDKMENDEKVTTMTEEIRAFDTWAKGEQGQGGALWASMHRPNSDKPAEALIKINEMNMKLPEGAYLQDAQESEYIICRDLGLKPSLHGISPSKSGSSPGSGSEDRVARTNHILDNKGAADLILKPLQVVARINGWPQGIKFFFNNYYAATLSRTMQVADMNDGANETA